MLDILVTVILALLISALLYGLFSWLKTPWYRVDAAKMISTLELVLTGQASDNQWHMTFAMSIRHDPELEAIRQRCCEIEELYAIERSDGYLFSREGLQALESIREELLQIQQTQ